MCVSTTGRIGADLGKTIKMTMVGGKALLLAVGMMCLSGYSAETIAYWPFGTNGFHDVSGNGHDLVGVEIAESDAGYVTLNGTSQCLRTQSALDLSGETAVTFECWTKMTGLEKDYPVLMCSTNPSAGTGGFVVYYQKQMKMLSAQYRMTTSNWQGDASPYNGAILEDSMWHHVAYVVDRSKTDHDASVLYVDGVAMEADTASLNGNVPAFFNDTLMIGGGANYGFGNNFVKGHFDDVRISRGALTPAEFLKYPSVGKAMRADAEGLPVVAYWPFGGKGGKDVTGNGYDLTMTGVPMVSGTPSPSFSKWGQQTAFWLPTNFPFSAFSRTGITIECLAKTDTSSNWGGILVESSTANFNNPGSFCINYVAEAGGFKRLVGAFRVTADTRIEYCTEVEEFGELNDGKWRHCALVYNPKKSGAERVALYVDGVAVTNCLAADTGTSPFALLDTELYFTRRANYTDIFNAVPFFGNLDDLRITAGVLTPDQFLSSRSSGSTVALYCFDKETLEDQTGNGHELVNEGNAAFGSGTHAASGTGLVLNGTSQWLHLKDALNLSHTKGMTVEYDCYDEKPATSTGFNGVFAATDEVASNGGFTIYRNAGNMMQAQFRVLPNTWQIFYGIIPDKGLHKGRYVIDTTASPQSVLYLNGSIATQNGSDTGTFSDLGTRMLCFGHSEGYAVGYMNGKYRRIAISDVSLAQADFVLDNLPYPEAKRTLAYWDFRGFSDKAGSGLDLVAVNATRRDGALALSGQTSYAETADDFDLSALSQVTVECFVLFGETPSSGTVFGMGEGSGSFAVTSDTVAGKLSGRFQPYQAAYNHQEIVVDPQTSEETTNTLRRAVAVRSGGETELVPLAGAKAWHHVALVIDRTAPERDAVRFYVDYERTELAGRAWDNAARLLSGRIVIGASAQYDDFFTGRIDDVRVSAGALSPAEFLQANQRTETPDGMILIFR